MNEIPKPQFTVGDRVCLIYNEGSGRFWRKRYLRHLIKHNRQACKATGPLPECIKGAIWETYHRFAEAREAEVVGVVPGFMVYNRDSCHYNACYLGGVSGASSPISYQYHLCIRWEDDEGRELALVTGIPVAEEHNLIQRTS
jgi:hypothetical protein